MTSSLPSPAPSPPNHIFVLEDDEPTRLLYRYILMPEYRLTMVATPGEALTALRASDPPASRPDLFLLDIHLRRSLTGIDVLRRIRKQPLHASTPAVAVTAYAQSSDRSALLDAGFDAYLSKPFYRSELLGAIGALLQLGNTH